MIIRLVLFLVVSLALPAWGQVFRNPNRSSLTNTVVIADQFINDGYFEVQNLLVSTNQTSIIDISVTPYDMTGVRTYVNNGRFVGLSARFETVDRDPANPGTREPADSFLNTFSGKIDFADGFHFGSFPIFQEFTRGVWSSPVSSVRVNAKTIVNEGLMRIGAGGLLRLGETNQVDGSLMADSITSSGVLAVDPVGYAYGAPLLTSYAFNLLTDLTYINDLGIYDFTWGQGTFTNQNLGFFVIATNFVITPEYIITNQYGTRITTSFALQNAQSWGYAFTKNDLTNIVIQAVFVETGDTNVVADVRWSPISYGATSSRFDANDFHTAIVKLSAVTTNALTLQTEESALYIVDQLGSGTNFNTIANDKYPFFYKPANYFITRSEPVEFLFGDAANTIADPALFYSPGFSNLIVTNYYSAYSFDMQNLVYRVPGVPGVAVEDLPGRIEINAKKVDLTGAGLRAEGLVSITTDQLESTIGTVIDAQNLSFDLAYAPPAGSPAQPFKIQNLAKDAVARFHGPVELWSGTFTNQVSSIQGGVTNVLNLQYHVLVVDARSLASTQQVSVANFQARAANLQVFDSMVVSNRFSASSADIRLSGNLELRNTRWSYTNLPNLVNLTIDSNVTVRAPGLIDFGVEPFTENGVAYKSLNTLTAHGDVGAYSHSIVAENVEITGEIRSEQSIFGLRLTPFGGVIFTNSFQTDSGPIYLTANRSARMNGGRIATAGDINLGGPVYKFDQFRVESGATINLNITNTVPGGPTALVDSGITSRNVFSSSNSIALNFPVTSGSLLGSTITTHPAARSTYRIRWAMPKNPAVQITNIPTTTTWTSLTNAANAVYTTNLGIGRLVLNTAPLTAFEFRGSQAQRAMYVDLLEITGNGITNLATLTSQLNIVSNSTSSIDIYYADIVATNLARNLNLGFQNLAEYFNGRKFGNSTMRWVPNFNGPNTSVDVVVGVNNASTVTMNRALRTSQIIDMDGDGIANGNDDFPFDSLRGPITISGLNISQVDGRAEIRFAAFQGTYTVQYAESLANPEWKTAATYAHLSSTATLKTVTDPAPIGSAPRFYRLLYTP